MLDLSAEITVWQGRAVVARRIRTVAQATEQVTWSLATDLRESGVLPRASTDRTVTAVIAVNPSDEAARVSVFAVGAEGSLPQEAFEVPPNGRTTFDLASIGPDLADLFVRLDANRPVAMESLVVPDDRRTISLLPPVDASAVWTVPLAEGRTLVLTNPGTRSVSVELERLGRGPRIRGVEVGPNRVVMVELEGEEPFGVLVRSSGGPVTAAAVGPRGTIPGVPFG
jgi:hypothetical protein